MRRFVFAALALMAVLAGIANFSGTASADNPADAPANQIGTFVAGIAQSVNFGLVVCSPAGQTQTEDDGALAALGLTPPGNTP